MANILLFAHDPGGANAIAPLIRAFKAGHKVSVFGKGPALTRLEGVQLIEPDTLSNVQPDFLITGTSATDMTEKHLWQSAAALGIPSIAVLDHWCNYGIRFSSLTTQELAQFDKHCDRLPDYIGVMDEFARREMANDGVPYDRIRVLGNPHFETLMIKAGLAPNVRQQFARDDEFLVTFASESNLEDNGFGDEKAAVAHLVEALLRVAALQEKTVTLVIRLHPKEAMEKYAEYLDRPGIILDKTTDGIALLMASDLVVSVSSMFLIEAVILGKPVISYQPSARNPDNFILTKSKTIPFIHTLDGLVKEINTIMNLNAFSGYDHGINMKATDSIVNFIESVL